MADHTCDTALQQIASDYPSLGEDVGLWRLLCRVASYVEQSRGQPAPVSQKVIEAPEALPEAARLAYLRDVFHLQDYELEAILVCLLSQISAAFREIYAEIQQAAETAACNAEVVKRVLQRSPHPAVAINTGSRLITQRLLEWQAAETEPKDETTPIAVSECILQFLLGRYEPDPRTDGILEVIEAPRDFGSLLAEPAFEASLRELAEYAAGAFCRNGVVFLFQGAYGTPRQTAAEAMSHLADRPIYRVDVAAALRSGQSWELLVELCFLAAAAKRAFIDWQNVELLLTDVNNDKFAQLASLAERHRRVVFLESTMEWEPLGQFYETAFLRVEFPMPGFQLQIRIWSHYLCRAKCLGKSLQIESLAEELASSFQLAEGAILDAINAATRLALVRDPRHPVVNREDLLEGCRRQAGRRLQDLAKHVSPHLPDPDTPPFSALVLPEANKKRLRELSQRIRRRSELAEHFSAQGRIGFRPGVVALFTGPSGTGKTMAVELLAGEHRRDLYRIDMAAIVSKFIGETEQNLHKVFSEAEGSNSILFFDECESLFAKRGEVRDPRDRWANMETNYLLQRIEDFEGVVILATNLRQNIDDAFQRRIHVAVEFPFPDRTARTRILANLLPPEDEIERPSPMELDAFAERFQISGGVIRNVIIDASFRALDEMKTARLAFVTKQRGRQATAKPKITLQHLVIALGREYEKLARPINQAEFGSQFFAWYEDYLNQPGPEPANTITPM